MNSLFKNMQITQLSGRLVQIANMPNALITPFRATDVADIRERIITISRECEQTDPQISRQLLAAKDILFVTDQLGQALINPYAIGRILLGLELLLNKEPEAAEEQHQAVDPWSYIHPLIQRSSKKLYEDGHFANAAEDAFIEINDRVKHLFAIIKPGEKVPDGDKVMTTVFSANSPLVEFCDRNTQSGQNKQKGYMEMLSGAISALRNPKAHSNSEVLSAEESYRRLATASMLMYAIDDAVKHSGITE